uniref:Large ribosomal subunit protein mL39 n=1 Tax=Glossina pallidipes TaxID=7398 RepID=A0A1A9Z6N3_GLOPL
MSVSKVMSKCLKVIGKLPQIQNFRCCSNLSLKQRNELFTAEQKRQRENVGRIEKIEVRYLGLPEDVTLVMNRDLSTPYNCAQHLSEGHCKRSVLSLVDGNVPWDMHRPLQASCTLQLLHFTISDPHVVNKTFWRSCSFMLGAALQNAFKEEAHLQLHSFPGPNIKTGSFIHDIVLGSRDWQPTKSELRALSAEMIKLASQDLKFERLEVNQELALEMFKDCRYKKEQLPSISQQNRGRIVLYRMGTHIDISKGPMISFSRFVGRCTVAAIHKLADEGEHDALYRVQGIALPPAFVINHVAYGILEDRAKKLNPARLPNEPFEESHVQIA